MQTVYPVLPEPSTDEFMDILAVSAVDVDKCTPAMVHEKEFPTVAVNFCR